MSEFDFAKLVRRNGVVYRSASEARWAHLFDKLHLRYKYEPKTFVLPDGTSYTPDFILGNGRVVEIKNGNVTTESLEKINNLAAHTKRPAILIDGTPNRQAGADVQVFDGRPPEEAWLKLGELTTAYAYLEARRLKASSVISLLAEPNLYQAGQENKRLIYEANMAAKDLFDGYEYDVTQQERDQLANKISGGFTEVVILDTSPEEIAAHITALPPRRIALPSPVYFELIDPMLPNEY